MAAQTLREALAAFHLYARIEGRKQRTVDIYDAALGALTEIVGDVAITEVRRDHIRAWVEAQLEHGYARTTINIHLRAIRAFFNWLVQEGQLESNPAAMIRQLPQPRQFPYVLTEPQVLALLKAAKGQRNNRIGKRNWAMILTLLDGMLRLAELKHLEVPQLSLSSRTITVISGKGDKDRVVPMGRRLTRAMRDWLQVRGQPLGEDRVFITQGDYGLDSRNVQRILQRLGDKAGLENVRCSPHTLRHTGATLFIRNGGDPFSLQQILGHSDISTTMVYVHMAGAALREAHAKASPIDHLLSR